MINSGVISADKNAEIYVKNKDYAHEVSDGKDTLLGVRLEEMILGCDKEFVFFLCMHWDFVENEL
jgi:hypothetical protein